MLRHLLPLALALPLAAAIGLPTQAQVVYRCPGNHYTSDQELSARQAIERGCRSIDGAPITVVQARRPKAVPAAAAAAAASGVGGKPAPEAASRPAEGKAETKVDPAAQRQRDSDARRILEGELRREEDRLGQLKREYNQGEPERRGDERNYQKYLDRVAEMRAQIARSEADAAAIRRELAKLGP